MISAIESFGESRHYGKIITESILDRAQELVNENGYVLDVAIAIACKAMRITENVPFYAYGK